MTSLCSALQNTHESYIINSNENIITHDFDVENIIKEDKMYNKIELNKIL